NSEVKRVGGWSNPRMGDHPGKLLRELPKTKPCGLHEAFWELTGFGFVGTPKLSEWEAGAIPGWVTTLGSCFVSSQKQNRAGCELPKGLTVVRVAQRTTQTLPSMILSSLGLATFSPARTVLFLGAHEATSQGVTHPGIAPASHSLNFGVPTNPKPVSSQKASRYEDARCAI
ncbi:hypothetical protein L3X38_045487, partial [Prunus dulcis]